MERDLNLIREILISLTKKIHSGPSQMLVNGYSKDIISYNCQLLVNAGYITALVSSLGTVLPKALTQKGQEFINPIRNWRTWDKVLAEIDKCKLPENFDELKSIITIVVRNEITQP